MVEWRQPRLLYSLAVPFPKQQAGGRNGERYDPAPLAAWNAPGRKIDPRTSDFKELHALVHIFFTAISKLNVDSLTFCGEEPWIYDQAITIAAKQP